MRPSLLLVPIAAVVAAGCASTPPPVQKYADAQSTIDHARAAGTAQYADSQYHTNLATQQLANAKSQINDGDNGEAARNILRAQTDADLSLALAHDHMVNQQTQQAYQQTAAVQKMEKPAQPPAKTQPQPKKEVSP